MEPTERDILQYESSKADIARSSAHDVLITIEESGREKAKETYIDSAESKEEEALARILIDAELMEENQGKLDQARKFGQKTEPYLTKAVDYNHLVGDFILDYLLEAEDNEKPITKSELTEWLEAASEDKDWAARIVSGASAEIAIYRMLKEIGHSVHLENVRNDRDHNMDMSMHGEDGKRLFSIGVETLTRERLLKKIEEGKISSIESFTFSEEKTEDEETGEYIPLYKLGIISEVLSEKFELKPDAKKGYLKHIISSEEEVLSKLDNKESANA